MASAGRSNVQVPTGIDNAIYDQFGAQWWDPSPQSPTAGLHAMNPLRVDYFARAITVVAIERPNLQCLQVLEIGCGGGILSEALARALHPHHVVGVDIAAGAVAVAEAHRQQTPDELDALEYVVGSAYKLPFADHSFDAVVMSDVLEHLDQLSVALAEMARVLRPGGVFVFDTFDRTWLSWFLGIFCAQTVLALLPNHTHVWSLFVRPDELQLLLAEHAIYIQELRGLRASVRPLSLLAHITGLGHAVLQLGWQRNTSVQYFGVAQKTPLTTGLGQQLALRAEPLTLSEVLLVLFAIMMLFGGLITAGVVNSSQISVTAMEDLCWVFCLTPLAGGLLVYQAFKYALWSTTSWRWSCLVMLTWSAYALLSLWHQRFPLELVSTSLEGVASTVVALICVLTGGILYSEVRLSASILAFGGLLWLAVIFSDTELLRSLPLGTATAVVTILLLGSCISMARAKHAACNLSLIAFGLLCIAMVTTILEFSSRGQQAPQSAASPLQVRSFVHCIEQVGLYLFVTSLATVTTTSPCVSIMWLAGTLPYASLPVSSVIRLHAK